MPSNAGRAILDAVKDELRMLIDETGRNGQQAANAVEAFMAEIQQDVDAQAAAAAVGDATAQSNLRHYRDQLAMVAAKAFVTFSIQEREIIHTRIFAVIRGGIGVLLALA